MNGAEREILNAVIENGNRITALETQKETQHLENTRNYEKLHKTISNVIKLKEQVFYQWFFISAIFLVIIALLFRSLNGS